MATERRSRAAAAAPLLLAALLAAPGLTSQQTPTTAARLAAAVLAENDGRLEVAERELRAALDEADADGRAVARARLAGLLRRQGRGDELHETLPAQDDAASANQDPVAGDPIRRMIRVLDSGSQGKEILSAKNQLESLGALVVPQLVAAFPELGPFGVHNALELLVRHDDSRIAALLMRQIESGDPAVERAIAMRLAEMPPAVAVPVASRVAEIDTGAPTQAAALAVLLQRVPDEPLTRGLAEAMARSRDEQVIELLLAAFEDQQRAWITEVCDELRTSGPVATRPAATFRWIRCRQDIEQAEAVAAIEALDPREIPGHVLALAEVRSDWVAVGALGLRAATDVPAWLPALDQLVDAYEWWRDPDVAVRALLALPMTRPSKKEQGNVLNAFGPPMRSPENLRDKVLAAIRHAASSGWRLPAELDDRMAEVIDLGGDYESWATLIAVLPETGEQRALGIWVEYERGREGIAGYAVDAGRPWHVLVARHLLSRSAWRDVRPELLRRDWHGANREAIGLLVKFAKRFGRPPAGRRTQWENDLVSAYRKNPDLPAEVVLPLVESGEVAAWTAVIAKQPRAALDWAMRAERLTERQRLDCAMILGDHGDETLVPFALRLIKSHGHSLSSASGHSLRRFLARWAPGSLEVVALAAVPGLDPGTAASCGAAAQVAAEKVRVERIGEALAMLPDVLTVAAPLLEALEPQVRREHAAIIAEAIVASLGREPLTYVTAERGFETTHYVQATLIRMLVATGAPEAVPALQQVLAERDLPAPVLSAAADAVVELAATDRRELVTGMLASGHAEQVEAALGAKEMRDPALRARAVRAIIRHGSELDGLGRLFEVLPLADRLDVATEILDSDRLPRFHKGVVYAALGVIAARNDAAYIPQLANVGKHPEWLVRKQAAAELGETFDRRAVPYLLALLKDEREDVRKAAQKSLDLIANYLDELAKWEKRFKGQ